MLRETLVSCLMVTMHAPARIAFMKKSIDSYCAQTHPRKELIIVQDSSAGHQKDEIAAYVAGLGRQDVYFIDSPDRMTLGALRNFSRLQAHGDIHCQWDDDDFFHHQRLENQLAVLDETGSEAVGLQDIMQFFPAMRELYWINWRQTEATIMPGSIMLRASSDVTYPETGEVAQRGEDLAICKQLLSRGALRALAGQPHSMIYVSHGKNTWHDGHHAMLAGELGVSSGLLRRREAELREQLAQFDFGPGDLVVRGPNGMAFSLNNQQGG